MKSDKINKKKLINKRQLINALTVEESLAELLRTEAKILRKLIKDGCGYEEIKNVNRVIKHILLSLTIMDDRIQAGLDIYSVPSEMESKNVPSHFEK